MLTGRPHTPMNFENANPGPPNDFPSLGAVVRRLNPTRGLIPSSITLPHHIFNTDGSVWPGQDAGFLGQTVDPWLVNCAPADKSFRIQGLCAAAGHARLAAVPPAVAAGAIQPAACGSSATAALLDAFDADTRQAFDLLSSGRSAKAFRLEDEPTAVRDRYGRSPFGQSVLLGAATDRGGCQAGAGELVSRSRRAAGQSVLGQPYRRSPTVANGAGAADRPGLFRAARRPGAAGPARRDAGRAAWPNSDAARGSTAARGGDHWGSVYSVALAGGGVRGGQAYGASDAIGGQPKEGRVRPQDLTATVFDCLGYRPETTVNDPLGRPLPISTGEPIAAIF